MILNLMCRDDRYVYSVQTHALFAIADFTQGETSKTEPDSGGASPSTTLQASAADFMKGDSSILLVQQSQP